MMRVIETCISKTNSMERFFDEKVFLKDIVVSGSTGDPPWKKIILRRNFFFTDFCCPQKNWIRLVSFINVVHKIDAINKNRSLEILFSKENMFLLNRFEWRSYKWGGRVRGGVGYWRPMIEGKNYPFENFFTQSYFI